MNEEELQAIEAALAFHPECDSGFWDGLLAEEEERHFLVHAAVEGMLSGNNNLMAIATEAERRGMDPHEVRHCLGRAFLAGMWCAAHEGVGHDPDEMARQFKKELQRHE